MSATMKRRDVVKTLLAERGDLLVVTGLGSATWDAAAAGDHVLTFPMWGAMGNAAMVGLGLALARPERRVLVLTGDGEMLMGIGSLATIAVQKPANLAIVVIDNEHFGETGMQKTHTAHGMDMAAVAKGCGIADSHVVRSAAELPALVKATRTARGPYFAQVKVVAEKLALTLPPRDGGLLKARFRRALLGESADTQ
ncbi:MAG: aldehyde dehydrogenase [Betaproteobacteria bacterium]|nr:aldehyde dehydrogenase [Betaproteobacteria bacterium]